MKNKKGKRVSKKRLLCGAEKKKKHEKKTVPKPKLKKNHPVIAILQKDEECPTKKEGQLKKKSLAHPTYIYIYIAIAPSTLTSSCLITERLH